MPYGGFLCDREKKKLDSPSKPLTVVKGWKTLDPAWLSFAASSVVARLDVFEHICSCCIGCLVSRAVDAFAFEHAEEAFAGGIIPAVSHCTHRADQLLVLQIVLVATTSKLTATIRVLDHFPGAARPSSALHGSPSAGPADGASTKPRRVGRTGPARCTGTACLRRS